MKEGNHISVSYYGQQCDFTVGSCEHLNELFSRVKIEQENLDHITADISDLDISGISNQDVSLLHNSSSNSEPCTPGKDSNSKRNLDQLASPPLVTSTPDNRSVEKMFRTPDQVTRKSTPSASCRNEFCKVTATTKIIISQPITEEVTSSHGKAKVMFDSIGGLSKQIELIKEMVQLPLASPQMFKIYGN